MTFEDVKKSIAKEAKIPLNQNVSLIERNIATVLEQLDTKAEWHFTIIPYTKTVPANKNYVSIGSFEIFRVSSALAIVESSQVELQYLTMTSFRKAGTAFYQKTNDSPTKYSVAGKRLYVGPGLLSAETVVSGDYRRKLSFEDITYFPSSLIIDGVVKRITKKGSDENIAAWGGWKVGLVDFIPGSKVTEERRSEKILDPQIRANNNYSSRL